MTHQPIGPADSNEALYIAFFEALSNSSFLLRNDAPRYTILAATEQLLKLSGRQEKALIGKPLFEAFPSNPEDKADTGEAALRSSLSYVLTNKTPHKLPMQRYDVRGENGYFEERYWKAENRPVFSAAGDVSFIVHTTEEITGKIKAEQRERQIEGMEKAYELFMQAPVAVCIVSGENHVVDLANEGMLQLLGRTKEMVGKPLEHTLPEAKKQGLLGILERVYATGHTQHAPSFPAELLINEQRDLRYFDLVFQPYYPTTEHQKPTSIFCIAYNITTQVLSHKKVEESEYRFRTLIEEASVATALYIGRELMIQYANDILIGYWGKDRSVIGKTLSQAVPELVGQPFLEYLNLVFETGEPYIGREEKAVLQVNGELQAFYFNFTYKALRDKEGTIYGIHHMAVDVTEQVTAKQQLKESETLLQKKVIERTRELETLNVELQRSNQNLEEFAHAASHDMKEPIRKVLTFSDRLRTSLESRLTESERQLFDRVTNATKRMWLLVDDLLEFSHVSERPLEKQNVDLNKKIKLVLTDLEMLIEEKKAIVELNALPVVTGYERQLQQLFHNLIGNALKYNKPDSVPMITISAEMVAGKEVGDKVVPESSEKRFHLIVVQDQGIGFEQVYTEKIFQMFQRLHGKSEYPGTGIGLSIARKVIENHQGYIWAESQPGEGATFKVLLPFD